MLAARAAPLLFLDASRVSTRRQHQHPRGKEQHTGSDGAIIQIHNLLQPKHHNLRSALSFTRRTLHEVLQKRPVPRHVPSMRIISQALRLGRPDVPTTHHSPHTPIPTKRLLSLLQRIGNSVSAEQTIPEPEDSIAADGEYGEGVVRGRRDDEAELDDGEALFADSDRGVVAGDCVRADAGGLPDVRGAPGCRAGVVCAQRAFARAGPETRGDTVESEDIRSAEFDDLS